MADFGESGGSVQQQGFRLFQPTKWPEPKGGAFGYFSAASG
jgi:hypothetical protein